MIVSRGRVGSDGIRHLTVIDHIGPFFHLDIDNRRHRLDAIDINLVQLLDETENGVQLVTQFLGAFIGDGDTRELGDSFDSGLIDGHGRLSGGRKISQPL